MVSSNLKLVRSFAWSKDFVFVVKAGLQRSTSKFCFFFFFAKFGSSRRACGHARALASRVTLCVIEALSRAFTKS